MGCNSDISNPKLLNQKSKFRNRRLTNLNSLIPNLKFTRPGSSYWLIQNSNRSCSMELNEIVTTRIFSYPRQLVWNAWTNPDHLKNWWGPNGFTNTFHQFD